MVFILYLYLHATGCCHKEKQQTGEFETVEEIYKNLCIFMRAYASKAK